MHRKLLTSIALVSTAFATANAQQKMKPEDTEYYSPVPAVVTPGKTCGAAPSDAIILFNGKDLSK
ncbi:MAG: DUF1080 domain-containing protein, partial [Ginsengibacter sp.]